MKTIKIKLITGIILLLLFSTLFGVFLYRTNVRNDAKQDYQRRAIEIRALTTSVEEGAGLSRAVDGFVVNDSREKAMLAAAACQEIMAEGWDGKVRFYQSGAIIKAVDGEVLVPEDFPVQVSLDGLLFTGKTGMCTSNPYYDEASGQIQQFYVYYTRVNGPFYYIEWDDVTRVEERSRALYDLHASLEGMEKAFGTKLLIFPTQAYGSGEHYLFYRSAGLPQLETAEAFGITQEMLLSAVTDPDTLTADMLADLETELCIEEHTYRVFLDQIHVRGADQSGALDAEGQEDVADMTIAFLDPDPRQGTMLLEQTALVLAVFFTAGVMCLIWIISVHMLVLKYNLNVRQKKELDPKRMARKVAAFLVIATAVLAAFSGITTSLYRIYAVREQVNSSFSSMQKRIEENAAEKRITEESRKEYFMEAAQLAAGILSDNPEFMTADNLQVMSDVLGADYIMLFDERGDEYLSNARYTGLSLGTDPASATWEFRSLLHGVPVIAHDAMEDEATKLTNVMIGASMGPLDENGAYGALLMAVPQEEISGYTLESISDIMSALVADGAMAFSVDPQSGEILDASSRELKGASAAALGLPEKALTEGYMDFFTFDGRACYGENEMIGETLFMYVYGKSHLYRSVLIMALLNAAAGCALLAVLALCLLGGYRHFFEKWAAVGDELAEEKVMTEGPEERLKYSLDPSIRWKPGISDRGLRTPFHNAFIAMEILLMISILGIGLWIFAHRSGSGESLIGYIVQGSWTRGFNLFAFTAILILLGEIYTVVTLLKPVLYLLSGAMGTRGETVMRLLMNLLHYASVIIFFYFALYDLGFDPTTLLASLGLLSFAISLGAKDLVTDIVAGLFIVFEGEYQVGDIIDVGGYRGRVQEIGIRTTKLEGRGGNIKILANRDVRNVINMTRKNSWYVLEVRVGTEHPLAQIEEMLAQQLPQIGSSIPEIISGPYYKGVVYIGNQTVTLSIIAECNEADYHSVQRSLNRAVQQLFENREIPLL